MRSSKKLNELPYYPMFTLSDGSDAKPSQTEDGLVLELTDECFGINLYPTSRHEFLRVIVRTEVGNFSQCKFLRPGQDLKFNPVTVRVNIGVFIWIWIELSRATEESDDAPTEERTGTDVWTSIYHQRIGLVRKRKESR